MRAPAPIAAAALCAAALASGTSSATAAGSTKPCAGAEQVPSATAASAARARGAIACLIDAARAERDLPALRRDARLRSAAGRYARALAPGRPLTHTGSGGSSPLDRIADAGYGRGAGGFSASETLGRGQGGYATPAVRVATWLEDASTRRLLLSGKYRDVGVGVVTRDGVTTYVVELARRTPAARSASASSKRASGSSRRSPNRSRS